MSQALTPQDPPAIEARGLRKQFGPKVAVDALTLTVARGDEFLDLHGKLHNVPPDVRRRRIGELLERVGLTEAAGRRLGTYSKGMLQRIGLAQALINDPELIFLDEPTSRLDPMGRRMVRDIIRSLRARGATVFLNSHLLSEVELTCTRVAFVAAGQVRHVAELGERADGLLQVDVRVDRLDEGLVQGLREWSAEVRVDEPTRTLTLRVASEEALPAIARWIVGRGTGLYSLTPRNVSLEDLFIRIVGEKTE